MVRGRCVHELLRLGTAIIGLIAMGNCLVFAQGSTAAISGVARDTTGALIPGVSVIVKHLESGLTRTAVTNENGGNVTHNLRDLMFRMQTGDTAVPEWAHRFDERLKEILVARDDKALVQLWPASDDARRSHPMPDHFLPIVYAYAVTDAHDSVRFPIEGFDHSASMRAMLFESGIFPS